MHPLVAVLILIVMPLASLANLASEYNHFVPLDPLQKMKLYWSVDHSDKRISFAVEARTTGWVGLGFSTAGRMKGADVVIGWVKDGKATLTNRHAVGHSLPLMDADQSTYELQSGTEVNGTTTLKFRRKFDTCSKQDRVIEAGTTKLIFAYNDQDPTNDYDMLKHSYKGARSILLLSYGKKADPDPSWSKIEMVMNNISVPTAKTSYLCKTFVVPDMPGKRHIVRFEPVVTPGNEGFVHHFVVNECHARFNVTHSSNVTNCLDYANMPSGVLMCRGFGEIAAAWGVGGGPFIYPEHVGYPVGTPDSGKIFIIEVHYDNPEQVPGRFDSSGVRFYYTDKLRDHDGGSWAVGKSVSNWMVIPPKQDNWIVESHCIHTCTEKFLEQSTLPGKGINIFAVFLHTHLAGRGTWTRHFRNGVELPEIARDNYYDFNFQEIQALPQEIHIRPGDDLIHTCRYSTMDRDKTTFGGLSTYDEMCMNFALYYPRLPNKFSYCSSSDIAVTYKFLEKYYPNATKYANKWFNPMVKMNVTWTDEMADYLRASISEAKELRTRCSNPNKIPLKDLAPGKGLMPKVSITKPLGPPVSDCHNSAQTLRGHGVLSVFGLCVLFAMRMVQG